MDDSASPQASTVQLTPYSLPLRLSSRLLQSHRIHTPALCERFSKRRFAVFERFTSRKTPDKCRISKTKREGHFSEKKQPYPSQQNSTTRAAQLAAPNRTAVPLPEVHGIFRSRTISVLSLKFPCHPLFESCICSWGTAARMNLENRSPISRAFRGGRGCGDGDLERFVRKT